MKNFDNHPINSEKEPVAQEAINTKVTPQFLDYFKNKIKKVLTKKIFIKEWSGDHAMQLIENGKAHEMITYKQRFNGLPEDKELALIMIKNGSAQDVALYLNRFEGLNIEVALKLIEGGWGNEVTKNLEKFEGLVADRDLAMVLVQYGAADSVATYIKKFAKLDKEVILKLLENKINYKDLSIIGENLDRFDGLDNEVAIKLIDNGLSYSVLDNLGKFKGINTDIIASLIDQNGEGIVIDNLEKLNGLLDKSIAMKIIEKGKAEFILENIEKFSGLVADKNLALTIMRQGDVKSVVKNLKRFSGLDKEIALQLIKTGLFDNITKRKIGHEIALKINQFIGLDKEVAILLIKDGGSEEVLENMEKFSGLVADKNLALTMIDFEHGARAVSWNLDKFIGLDKEVAKRLLISGRAKEVGDGLKYFKIEAEDVASFKNEISYYEKQQMRV